MITINQSFSVFAVHLTFNMASFFKRYAVLVVKWCFMLLYVGFSLYHIQEPIDMNNYDSFGKFLLDLLFTKLFPVFSSMSCIEYIIFSRTNKIMASIKEVYDAIPSTPGYNLETLQHGGNYVTGTSALQEESTSTTVSNVWFHLSTQAGMLMVTTSTVTSIYSNYLNGNQYSAQDIYFFIVAQFLSFMMSQVVELIQLLRHSFCVLKGTEEKMKNFPLHFVNYIAPYTFSCLYYKLCDCCRQTNKNDDPKGEEEYIPLQNNPSTSAAEESNTVLHIDPTVSRENAILLNYMRLLNVCDDIRKRNSVLLLTQLLYHFLLLAYFGNVIISDVANKGTPNNSLILIIANSLVTVLVVACSCHLMCQEANSVPGIFYEKRQVPNEATRSVMQQIYNNKLSFAVIDMFDINMQFLHVYLLGVGVCLYLPAIMNSNSEDNCQRNNVTSPVH